MKDEEPYIFWLSKTSKDKKKLCMKSNVLRLEKIIEYMSSVVVKSTVNCQSSKLKWGHHVIVH